MDWGDSRTRITNFVNFHSEGLVTSSESPKRQKDRVKNRFQESGTSKQTG